MGRSGVGVERELGRERGVLTSSPCALVSTTSVLWLIAGLLKYTFGIQSDLRCWLLPCDSKNGERSQCGSQTYAGLWMVHE